MLAARDGQFIKIDLATKPLLSRLIARALGSVPLIVHHGRRYMLSECRKSTYVLADAGGRGAATTSRWGLCSALR
eukprot:561784-Pyramimonas_sp.AAC.1